MNPYSVLIIDDNVSFCNRLRLMLEESNPGSRIAYVDTVERALQELEEKEYSLLLLDIQLPQQSGIVLLKKLKKINWPGTTIVVSNLVDAYYRKVCEKWGAAAFFDKTKELEILISDVNRRANHIPAKAEAIGF